MEFWSSFWKEFDILQEKARHGCMLRSRKVVSELQWMMGVFLNAALKYQKVNKNIC